jgi:hypothetical protein
MISGDSTRHYVLQEATRQSSMTQVSGADRRAALADGAAAANDAETGDRIDSDSKADAYYEAARLALGLWFRSWPLGGHLYDPAEPDRDRLTLRLAGSSGAELFAGSGARGLVEADVMINVAGFAALLKRGCTIEWPSGEPEVEKCRHWLGEVMPEDRVEGELLRVVTETRVLLERPQIWSAVETIAAGLAQHGELYGQAWAELALTIARKMHGDPEVERGLKSRPNAPNAAWTRSFATPTDTPKKPKKEPFFNWLILAWALLSLGSVFASQATYNAEREARRHAAASPVSMHAVAPQDSLPRAP